jgi:hypothetical protein
MSCNEMTVPYITGEDKSIWRIAIYSNFTVMAIMHTTANAVTNKPIHINT